MKKKLLLSLLVCSSLLIAGGDPLRPPQRSDSANNDNDEATATDTSSVTRGQIAAANAAAALAASDSTNPPAFSLYGDRYATDNRTPGCLHVITAAIEGTDQWLATAQPLNWLNRARSEVADAIAASAYLLLTGEMPGDEHLSNDDDNTTS